MKAARWRAGLNRSVRSPRREQYVSPPDRREMTIKTIRKPVRSIGNPSLSSGVPTLSSVGTLFLDMTTVPTNSYRATASQINHSDAGAPLQTPRVAVAKRCLALLGVLGAAVGGLTACQQPLFDARDPRSQYDRADAARNTRPEQFVMDEYGNRRPNIRGRLIGNQ